MPSSDGAEKFRLGINMAGAISAGAYTAGVLDFLIEAFDEWHDAKSAYTPGASSPAKVPMHDVTIEALGGASAGGMCAAIAAIALQSKFDHVRTARNTGKTNNALYESW